MVLNNHSTRERYIKLLPQTHSPGVDYSLFIMEMLMMMLERVEIQPVMTPAAFPPPIFLVLPLFRCLTLRSASSEIAIGDLFIDDFRSKLGV